MGGKKKKSGRRSSLARLGRRVSLALTFGKSKGSATMKNVQIRLLNGGTINITVKQTTTAGAVCVALRSTLRVDNDCDYSLYLATGDGSFSALDHDMRLVDVISKLPAVLRGAANFYYKRRVYFPGGQTEVAEGRCSDPEQGEHKLAFMDAVYHYLHGHYRFPPTAVPELSALLLQSHVGDHNPAQQGAEQLMEVLPAVIPACSTSEDPAKVVDGITESAEVLVAETVKHHADLHGLTKMEAQVTFLNKVKAFSAYGCDFFPSKRTWKSRDESGSEDKVKARTEDTMVAIGKEGVHLWTESDPFNESQYGFEIITKWTVSRDGKIFAFCVEDEIVVYLVTTQATTIESVIERYVHDLVASRGGATKDPIVARDAGSAQIAAIEPPPVFMTHNAYHINLMGRVSNTAVSAAAAFAKAGKKKKGAGGAGDESKSSDAKSRLARLAAGARAAAPATAAAAAEPEAEPEPAPEAEAEVEPEPEPEVVAEAGAEAGGTAEEALAEAAADGDADSLADGYEAVPTDDGVYYYNAETGESTWDKPRKPKAEVAAEATAGAGGAGAGAAEESGLPAGWVAEQDAEGYTYYVNEYTEETQWELPTEPAAGAEAAAEVVPEAGAEDATVEAAAGDAAAAALPEGWEACQDDNGDTYYWNVNTGETAWEAPTE